MLVRKILEMQEKALQLALFARSLEINDYGCHKSRFIKPRDYRQVLEFY